MRKFTQISDEPNIVYVSPKMIDDRIEASYYKKQYLDADEKIVTFNNGFIYLENLCTKITDGTHKTPDYKSEGIKFISAKNILEDSIDFEDIKYISEDEHNEISKRCKVKPEDILFTKIGRIGYAKVVPANVSTFSIFVSVALLKLKSNVDNRFIEAFLNSKYGRIQSERLVKGSNQPDFHLENIAEIKVPIPSSEIQKYIGDKVRRAEELREEAKRLKKEAEEILKVELGFNILQVKLSVYKEKFSWIKTKELDDRMDGEFYKTDFILNNEHIDILKNNGVQVLRLKDIIDKGSYGILPSSDDYGKGEVVLLRSTNLKEFLIDASDVIKVPECYYKEKVQVNEGDILLEIKGQCYSGAIATELKNKTIVNGSIYKFSVKKGFNNYYILAYLLSKSGQLQKQQNLANSIISYLSIDCINNLKIPVVSMEKQQIIGGKYKAYVEQMNKSKQLIQEAKQDVEDLIEGNFDMSKVRANS